ncbi:hypothetical protein C0Z18_21800 [Trinickia dabaoshanensis]|uniref:Uncharacterized protein n=1 Tax=Trinickia dabaoshanensis TaxID=564714 RepID=A0A2N7VIX3_9BURK|nr:hypothetical protein [Trinickia dabaoshanensis]PMS17090.1 hypothetical protein C0Z18_21800 [Trinickia dabaoshanensis]
MNEHDHFSNVLDVEAVEESHERQLDDGFSAMAADDDEARAHEPQTPRKKPIPKALLLAGGMVAFIVVGAGYQHFFGARPQSFAQSGMLDSGAGDAHDIPLPSGTAITQQTRGDMLQHGAPPLPSPATVPASGPIGDAAAQQGGHAAFADATSAASAGMGEPAQTPSFGDNAFRAASAVPAQIAVQPAANVGSTASPTASAMLLASARPNEALAGTPAIGGATASAVDSSAAMSGTPMPDPKDAEIAKLQAELDALRKAAGASAPVHVSVHRVGKHSHHAAHIATAPGRPIDSANLIAGAQPSSNADASDASNAAQMNAGADAQAPEAARETSSTARVKSSKRPGRRHEVRYGQRQVRKTPQLLTGYAIKQVIPGQGWIEDQQSGKQQVVAVGDLIGGAKVVRIDPDNYRIVTTAGVIQ